MALKDIYNSGYPSSDSKILDPAALRAARGRANKHSKVTRRLLSQEEISEADSRKLLTSAVDVVKSTVEETVNPVPERKTIMYNRVTTGKSPLVRYTVEGRKGLIRFSPTLFTEGAALPASTESLDSLPWADPKAAKAPKVLTPEQLEAERKKIEALEARIAKRKARLAA